MVSNMRFVHLNNLNLLNSLATTRLLRRILSSHYLLMVLLVWQMAGPTCRALAVSRARFKLATRSQSNLFNDSYFAQICLLLSLCIASNEKPPNAVHCGRCRAFVASQGLQLLFLNRLLSTARPAAQANLFLW